MHQGTHVCDKGIQAADLVHFLLFLQRLSVAIPELQPA